MIDIALAAQVLVWLIVLGVFLASGQATIFHPATIYLLFHWIVFVARPLLVYYLKFDREWLYMHFEPSDEYFIRALAASSLALVVFCAASITSGWSRVGFETASPAPFTREQRTALLVLTVVLAPVIAYSIHAQYSGDFTIELRGSAYVMTGASGYTLEAQYMAGGLVCAWLAVKRFRGPVLLLLIPYILYRAYVGMSRWTLVLMFVALALVYGWQRRLKWPPVWAVFCVLPVYLLFRAIGDDRGVVEDLLTGQQVRHVEIQSGMSDSETMRVKYDNPDFANFDYLTFVAAVVPEKTGTYTFGTQYLQLFTEPIPRKLWPGKPAGAPIGFFSLNNYGDFLGLTVSIVGDGWMSGGWVGVTITMMIVGVILGSLHRWFWRHSASNMAALFYLVGLAMLPQWYRDGGISIAKFLFWNLSPLVLWVGLTWILGGCQIRARSILLPQFAKVRLVFPEPVPRVPGAGRLPK